MTNETIGETVPGQTSDTKAGYPRETTELNTTEQPAHLKYNPFFWGYKGAGRFTSWINHLSKEVTAGLLLSIFAIQHMQKGLAQSYISNSVSFYFRDRGGVSASELQIYMSVIFTPWSLKGLMGVGSDVFAFMGYHKIPFMLITATAAIFALFFIGTTPNMTILGALLCLFTAQFHIALNDLLIEAKYSEKIQENPAVNADLVSYVWGGMMFMSLVAVGTIGVMISYLGARSVFGLVTIPIFLGSIPLLFNLMGDRRVEGNQCCYMDTSILSRRGWEYTYLATAMTILSLALANSSIFYENIKFNFLLAMFCGILTILGFFRWTPPMIAKVNAYTLIQTLFSCSIEGATFYFFTDGPDEYPEGPHFSDWFYTTAVGMVSAVTAIVGIILFNIYLKDMKYRTIFLWSTLVYSAFSLVNIVVYLRLNKRVGISDQFFVLGSQALQTVIKEFNYMPAVMIMSRLCPRGLEATMFALLASSSNLGSNISNYSGAFLLDLMGVKPSGRKNESEEFENLWLVALIVSILPALPLVLLPYLIPDARPNDLGPLPGVEVEEENRRERERKYGVERNEFDDTKALLEEEDEEPAGLIAGSSDLGDIPGVEIEEDI